MSNKTETPTTIADRLDRQVVEGSEYRVAYKSDIDDVRALEHAVVELFERRREKAVVKARREAVAAEVDGCEHWDREMRDGCWHYTNDQREWCEGCRKRHEATTAYWQASRLAAAALRRILRIGERLAREA